MWKCGTNLQMQKSIQTSLHHLNYWVFPKIQTEGFHSADCRQISVQPWTIQANKNTKGARGPAGLCEDKIKVFHNKKSIQ